MYDLAIWLSVLALLLAVPLGVASNLLTPRLISFLETRKLIKTHKTRQQALQGYNRIKAFREGRRDRYPFYILLAILSILCAVAASTILILSVLITFSVPVVVPILIALVCALLAALFLVGIYETSRQIERFDAYKAELEKRWGHIEDAEPNVDSVDQPKSR
jgi:hypothetical protein